MSAAPHPHDDFLPAPMRAAAPYLLLALAVFAAYGNVYDNAFLFDDDLLIQLNSYLTGWSHVGDILTGSTTDGAHIAGGFYRPLQILLYLLVTQLAGGGVFWFHLLNVSLHTANACLMYRLGLRLGFNPWGVFLASLIWCLHPLHTEAVTYMSATADPLFAFFCLIAVNALLPRPASEHGADIAPRAIFRIIPLFLLGLASKETMVMFPLLVMACLFYVSPGRFDFRTYIRTWPLWAIALIYVAWRMQAKGFDGPQTYGRFYGLHEFANLGLYADHVIYRVYTFLATLPAYLELLVWPHGLHMERAFSIYTQATFPPVVAGAVVASLAAAYMIRSCRAPHRGLALSWGLLWFAAAHAPDTGILIPMNALFLEHWMYLPTVGLFLGLGETAAGALRQRPRAWSAGCAAAALAFAAILAVKTYQQNDIWKTPETFYTNIFAYGEASARARNNLALYYTAQGRYEDAVEQFNQAVKISDSYAETRYNMAIAYLNAPDRDAHVADAIANLKRSIEIDPRFYRSYILLSKIYDSLHDQENADYYRQRGAELSPR